MKAALAIISTYVGNRLRIKPALIAFWADSAFSSTIIALALSAMVAIKDYHVYYATGVALFLGIRYGTIIANELGWERGWEVYLMTLPTKRALVFLSRVCAWSIVSLIYGAPPILAVLLFSGPTGALPASLGLVLALVLASSLGVAFVTFTKLHPLSLTALHGAVMPLVTRFSTSTYPRMVAPEYARPLVEANPLGYIADLVRYLQGFPGYLLADPALSLTVVVSATLGLAGLAAQLYERRVEGVVPK